MMHRAHSQGFSHTNPCPCVTNTPSHTPVSTPVSPVHTHVLTHSPLRPHSVTHRLTLSGTVPPQHSAWCCPLPGLAAALLLPPATAGPAAVAGGPGALHSGWGTSQGAHGRLSPHALRASAVSPGLGHLHSRAVTQSQLPACQPASRWGGPGAEEAPPSKAHVPASTHPQHPRASSQTTTQTHGCTSSPGLAHSGAAGSHAWRSGGSQRALNPLSVAVPLLRSPQKGCRHGSPFLLHWLLPSVSASSLFVPPPLPTEPCRY